jgi:O-antigen/teichoic acid export membrane protein
LSRTSETRRELSSVAVLSATGALVRALSGLVVMKAIALSLGAAGFAQFAQAQNLVSMLAASAATGIGNGVTRTIARDRSAGSFDDHRRLGEVVGTASWFATWLSVPLALVLLAFAEPVAAWLFNDASGTLLVRCAAAALPFACLAPLPLAALNGQQESLRCVVAPIVTTLAASLVTVALVLTLELPGAAISIAAGHALTLLVNTTFFGSRNPIRNVRTWLRSDRQTLRQLLGFAVMAVVGGLAMQGALLFVRTTLAVEHGWVEAGQWQAVVKISEVYLSAITMALTVYYLPRLSAVARREDFVSLLRTALSLVVPATAALTAVIWVMRDQIVALALTAEFAPAADVMWLQLLGDLLKVVSILFAMVMWARGMVVAYLLLEIGASALYAGLAWWWSSTAGVYGAVAAHVAMYGVYCAVCAFVALHLADWKGTAGTDGSGTA